MYVEIEHQLKISFPTLITNGWPPNHRDGHQPWHVKLQPYELQHSVVEQVVQWRWALHQHW
jgi:hypothetical protein